MVKNCKQHFDYALVRDKYVDVNHGEKTIDLNDLDILFKNSPPVEEI